MTDATSGRPYPDGLAHDHAVADRGFRRHASPVSILLIGALLLAAMLGLLGGTRTRAITASRAAADLTVVTPRILRNGLFFETRIIVRARAAIAKPTLAIDATLWRDMTINTQFPDAKEQGFKDGAYTFEYAPLKAGETLELKFDGQINPPLTVGTSGTIALSDGDRPLVALPVTMTVLP
jgi:hypothetical protein